MQIARTVPAPSPALWIALCIALWAPADAGARDGAHADRSPALLLEGSLRERATWLSALDYEHDHHDEGWFWTQRLTLDASLATSARFSLNGTLLSALSSGVEPTPLEQNELDVQRLYAQYRDGPLDVRIGRQEIRLGSQRLVGWRDGTNVRRAWDGVRIRREAGHQGSAGSLDVFALQQVEVVPEGAFDDRSNEDERLYGIYLTRHAEATAFDVYWLLSDRDDRPSIEGVGDEMRHSFGARLFGERGAWFWNWEAVVQVGEHGDDDILAWTFATNTGRRFDAPWQPEVMLSVNIASGDDDVGDGELGTFQGLYPRGSYFSELALLGPSNFYNFHPYLRLHPRPGLELFVDVNWYWRLEEQDGIYRPSGTLLRGPGGSEERAVNRAVSAGFEWEPREWLAVSLLYTYSAAARFIEETGPAEDIDFLEFSISTHF